MFFIFFQLVGLLAQLVDRIFVHHASSGRKKDLVM